jgi:hypothetical protein
MSDEMWKRDDVQFPRLLAEIRATVDTSHYEKDLLEGMDLTAEQLDELFDRAQREWECVKKYGPDTGCSEAGNTWSGYGVDGKCPIRGTLCPHGCLMKTIESLKLDKRSHPLNLETARRVAREMALEEAAQAVRHRGGKSYVPAILALKEK